MRRQRDHQHKAAQEPALLRVLAGLQRNDHHTELAREKHQLPPEPLGRHFLGEEVKRLALAKSHAQAEQQECRREDAHPDPGSLPYRVVVLVVFANAKLFPITPGLWLAVEIHVAIQLQGAVHAPDHRSQEEYRRHDQSRARDARDLASDLPPFGPELLPQSPVAGLEAVHDHDLQHQHSDEDDGEHDHNEGAQQSHELLLVEVELYRAFRLSARPKSLAHDRHREYWSQQEGIAPSSALY